MMKKTLSSLLIVASLVELCSCVLDDSLARMEREAKEEIVVSQTISKELTASIRRFDVLSKCTAQFMNRHRLRESNVWIPELYVIICPKAFTETSWRERIGKSSVHRSAAVNFEEQIWKTTLNDCYVGKNIRFPYAEISLFKRDRDSVLLNIQMKPNIYASCLTAADGHIVLAVDAAHQCEITLESKKFTIAAQAVDSDIELVITAASESDR